MRFSAVTPSRPDPYYLRGLLYCRSCHEPLRPALSPAGQRSYGCPAGRCDRPWVPAEPIERQVWTRFESLNEQAAREISGEQRQEALGAVLNRVTIGNQPDDLEYDWRD